MLDITGPGSISTCDGVTGRDFVQVGALGFSMAKLKNGAGSIRES